MPDPLPKNRSEIDRLWNQDAVHAFLGVLLSCFLGMFFAIQKFHLTHLQKRHCFILVLQSRVS
jgi:hypothetical protein